VERMIASWQRIFAVLMVSLVFGGCGRHGPAQYPVCGTVTYRGKTVPTGNVMFVPKHGTPTAAVIGPDGSYRLMAAVGEYQIGVTAVSVPPPGANPETHHPSPPLVPPKFGRPETSGLLAEVDADRQNRIDFKLR
jgi:hypothetical protein